MLLMSNDGIPCRNYAEASASAIKKRAEAPLKPHSYAPKSALHLAYPLAIAMSAYQGLLLATVPPSAPRQLRLRPLTLVDLHGC